MLKNFQSIDFSPARVPPRRTLWLIFLSAAVLVLIFLGSNGLLDSEANLAEGVRELLMGKDIFSPDNWWQPDEKTSLWFCRLRSLPVLLTDGGEFFCRCLSLIPALMLLAGTIRLAWRFFDRRVMYCSGWMLIGSYGFIYWSRNAGSFITLAAWVIWSIILLAGSKRALLRWFGFFILFFTGSAFWGMNYLLTLPAAAVWALADEKSSLRKFCWWQFSSALISALPVTVLLLAAAVSFPGVPVAEYPGRIWRQLSASFAESWQITVLNGQNWRACGYGWVNLARLLFPWTLPALAALAGMFWKWRELSGVHKKLLAGAVLLFICTGLFPGRRWQYQLCQLPLFLVLAGGGICRITGVELWHDWSDRIMKWAFSLLCSFAASVMVLWPLWDMVFYEEMPWSIIAGIPILGFAGLGFLIFDTGAGNPVERFSGMRGSWSGYILAGVCLTAAIFAVGISELGSYRTGKIFWQKCAEQMNKKSAELVCFGFSPDAEALYYMKLNTGCAVAVDCDILSGILEEKIRRGDDSLYLLVQEKDREAVLRCAASAGWHSGEQGAVAVEGSPQDMAGEIYLDSGRNYLFYLTAGISGKNGKN